jgi:co-chaperonin GroES (HSP10)
MKKKDKFEPIGKWMVVKNDMGGQKTTESGIIYTEKHTGQFVKSEVVQIGEDLSNEHRIKVGDTVYWDAKRFTGNTIDGNHIIHIDWVGVVAEQD